MISIIIPIYNAAKTLSTCLDSIVCQEYSDYEVLLVDDGSKDESAEICADYCQRDRRFHYIHKGNGGVSSARNVGLKNAAGEFIAFIDADDWVKPQYLTHLTATPFADISIMGLTHFGVNDKVYAPKVIGVFTIVDHLPELLSDISSDRFYWYPFGKLFRSSIIKQENLFFDERMFYSEDTLFVFQYLSKATDISMLSSADYMYNLPSEDRASKFRMDFTQFSVHYKLMNDSVTALEKKCNAKINEVRYNLNRRLSRCFISYFKSIKEYSLFKDVRQQCLSTPESERMLSNLITTHLGIKTKALKYTPFLMFLYERIRTKYEI